jgi:hypothetical protein
MAILSNHYEKAFRNYIRSRRVGCIAVDESQRSWDDDQTLKSLDFIVTPPGVALLLVDVKGRKTPPGGRSLDNWATQDDIDSLSRWEETFGPTATALLVFTYLVSCESDSAQFTDRYFEQERYYGFLSIPLAEYRRHLRVRSRRWGTVCIPRETFHEIARPVSHWLDRGSE